MSVANVNSSIISQRRHRTQQMPKHMQKLEHDSSETCGSGSFVGKLYRMVDNEPSTIVSWVRGGTAFCIVDPKLMAEHCLPKYFRHRRFSSLIRQLNFYSFYRVQEGQLTIYQHSYFRKDRPDLLMHIKRRAAGKAKDPWIDPLSSYKQEQNLTLNSHHTTVNGEMCYSPLAKPLMADNMSPALKPGMSPVLPSHTELMETCGHEKRYEKDCKENGYLLASDMQLKQELLSPKAMPNNLHAYNRSFRLEIDDFLSNDCDFTLGFSKIDEQFECEPHHSTHEFGSSWEFSPSPEPHVALSTNDTFEDELLLDLATVEPETWEIPLSPLNDEEDMMPWLDVCFK